MNNAVIRHQQRCQVDQNCLTQAASVETLPLFLTADETAALLRTTRKGIYSMIERGQLPGVTRIGRRVLLRRDDLLEFLRQKSTPSQER
jgi:excisionase family DNA binding protein